METWSIQTYNVTFVLTHSVITVAISTDATDDEEIAKAARDSLAADGIDLSNTNVQDYTVELL